MELLGVFPIPIGMTKLNRDFTGAEKECFDKISKKTYNNYGNLTSHEKNVLNLPGLENLKKFCIESVELFVKSYDPPKHFLSFYITQSWINYTGKNQNHHSHTHREQQLFLHVHTPVQDNLPIV